MFFVSAPQSNTVNSAYYSDDKLDEDNVHICPGGSVYVRFLNAPKGSITSQVGSKF